MARPLGLLCPQSQPLRQAQRCPNAEDKSAQKHAVPFTHCGLSIQLPRWGPGAQGICPGTILLRLLYRQGKGNMVERKKELKRRYHRKHKLKKLKAQLGAAKDGRGEENIM